MTVNSTCKKCGAPILRQLKGRPPIYCSTRCRQTAAAERARHPLPSHRTSAPGGGAATVSEHAVQAARAELIGELVKDMHDGLRQVTRCLNQDDGRALDVLQQLGRLEQTLDRIKDGMVSRASYQGASWQVIGQALNKSAETVRKTFASSRVAKRLGPLPVRRSVGDKARGASPPDRMAGELTTISRAASNPVFNRLAPVLSALARQSALPQQTLAERVGCSPSFLSRVLNGDRLPSWSLTERLVRALGADLAVIRTVWESEKLRDKSSRPTLLPALRDASNTLQVLRTAMEILRIRSGATRLRTELPTTELFGVMSGRAW